jgi:hypothetical protein
VATIASKAFPPFFIIATQLQKLLAVPKRPSLSLSTRPVGATIFSFDLQLSCEAVVVVFFSWFGI